MTKNVSISPFRLRLPSRGRRALPARIALEPLELRLAPAIMVADPALLVAEKEPNDSFAQAQILTPPDRRVETSEREQWLTVTGTIDPAPQAGTPGDADYFKITRTDVPKFALMIDLDRATDAINLTLDVYDANQARLFTSFDIRFGPDPQNPNQRTLLGGEAALPFDYFPSDGAAGAPAAYLDLPKGTYFVKVSSSQGSGDYTLRVLTDSVYSRTVPDFNSRPTATAQLYLDFDGHSGTNDYWTAFEPAARNGYTFTPFNLRGDGHEGIAAEFSPGERVFMLNTYRTVAEDFAPFNLNVTTRAPAQFGNNLAIQAVVANKNEQGWKKTAAGYAPLNTFRATTPQTIGPALNFINTDVTFQAIVFQPAIKNNRNTSILQGSGTLISHETGHGFGLSHQFLVGADGKGLPGIMNKGSANAAAAENLDTWVNGINSGEKDANGNFTIPPRQQNDLSELGALFGFRTDEPGVSVATAEALLGAGNVYSKNGVIEKSDDADFFSFVGSGKTTIQVTVPPEMNDPNLDTILELFDSTGTSLGIANPANAKDAALVDFNLPQAGTFVVKVSGTGLRPGGLPNQSTEVVGGYTLRVTTAVPARNQPPVLSKDTIDPVAFTQGNPPIPLNGNGQISDADSMHFNGGSLSVHLSAGSTPDDKLTLVAGNGVEVGVDGTVRFNGQRLGRVTEGGGTAPFRVTFETENATPASAQAVMRQVAFQNQATTPQTATRIVEFVVTDQANAASAPVIKSINVSAPARPQMKVEENQGLTAPTDGPKAIAPGTLLVTSPVAGAAVVVYTLTKTPTNGQLLFSKPSDSTGQPDFLPFALVVGDTFTQADINAGRVSYRLNIGSTASTDRYFFTAKDDQGNAVPETPVEIRVSRGAAPGQGGIPQPMAFAAFANEIHTQTHEIRVILGATASDITLGPGVLSFTGVDDPRDLRYDIVSSPRFGTLNLPTRFTQKDINDNLLSYRVPRGADVPPEAVNDRFVFVVSNTVTGGISDPITFSIGFDQVNATPVFQGTDLTFFLNPYSEFGPRQGSTLVRDLVGGRISDPDHLEGDATRIGIAIVAADSTNGQWQFTTDNGETWTALGSVSETSALLLDGTGSETALRFIPNATFSGQAELQFHAWDETPDATEGASVGSNGSRTDLTIDESNSFSSAVARAVQIVRPEERDPTFTAGPAVTVNEDAGLVVIPHWATNIQGNGLGFNVAFQVDTEDDDPTTLEFISLPEIGPEGTLRFQLAPDSFGTATFNVTPISNLSVGRGTGLTITVLPVNDPPSLTVGPNVQLNPGAGPIQLSGWATGISAGPANEATQSLGVNITTDNPALFAVLPTLDLTSGTLTFTPSASGGTTARVSINLSDDGGASNGGQNATTRVFTVTLATPPQGIRAVSDTDSAWVAQVYRDLLGREVESGGMTFWSQALSQGATRTQVIQGLQSSPEYSDHQAAGLYRTFLRREADASGRSWLAGLLTRGASLDQAKAALISSNEYFQTRGNGTSTGFLTALYEDVLHRSLDTSGGTSWSQALATGTQRSRVALAVLGTVEADQALVRETYQSLLGRSAEDNGLRFFTTALQQGLREEAFLSGILASQEYYARIR